MSLTCDPGLAFAGTVSVRQSSAMSMLPILRTLLAVVVMAGLASAPIAAPAAAKTGPGAVQQMSGDMPCCPDEAMRDGCKDCPCLAVCVMKTFQAAPMIPNSVMYALALASDRVFANDALADGLGPPPPARPPRA